MSEIKGRGWITQWGTTDGPSFVSWCEILKDLSAEQIKLGYIKFMNSDDEFLDGKKFRKLCIDKGPHSSNWQAYKIFERPALPDLGKMERSKKARDSNIKEIIETLRQSK